MRAFDLSADSTSDPTTSSASVSAAAALQISGTGAGPMLASDTTPPAAPRLVTGSGFKALVDPLLLLQTSKGAVLLELSTNHAPVTVENILAYANDGFLDNTLFHRVVAGFVVQGGGLTAGLVTKTPTYSTIPLESNNGQSNLRGTVAMARTAASDSATSQFFVNLVDNTSLNYASAASPGYAVFGKVVTGMAVIDSIAAVPTATVSGFTNVPLTDILTNSATLAQVGQSISNAGNFSVAGLEAGGRFEYSLNGGNSWNAGVGSSFAVPAGHYNANMIAVRQFDAAGNQSLAVGRFADTLDVGAQYNVSPNHTPTGSVRVTGVATLGQALSVSMATLADADGLGAQGFAPSFQWLRGGEFVAGATGSSYQLAATDIGASISVRISYTDSLGRVENVASSGSTLNGDNAANLLAGSDYNDSLSGLDGDDRLDGGFGTDTLLGGAGLDTLDGGQGADSLSGGDGNDSILGSAGTDTLLGGTGNDTLDGGLDTDTMAGGTGDDVYMVDNQNDIPVESADEGVDEMRSSISANFYLPDNIENLTLIGSADIYAIGNALNNVLTGNSGANILLGLAGNDTLIGGAGADVAYYLNDTAGVSVNLASGTAQDGFGGTDSLVGMEWISGSNFNDTLIGDAGSNLLRGYAGNDSLGGGGGNDVFVYAANGNGIDTIGDFGVGDLIRVSGASFPPVPSSGDGSALALNRVQVASSGGITTISAGTDAAAGADISIRLTGSFAASQFYSFGTDIGLNQLPRGSVTFTGTVASGQTLTASNTLADGDGIPTSGTGRIVYQWNADGTAISGASASTFLLTQAQAGKTMTVTASYVDGHGTPESVTGGLPKGVELLAYSWKTHTLLDGVSIASANQNAITNAGGAAGFTAVTEVNLGLTALRPLPAPEQPATFAAVNLTDAIAILKMIVGLPVNGANQPLSPYQALAADFDGDGSIALNDAIGVLRHVVGLPAAAPAWHFANEADLAVAALTGTNPGAPPAINANISGAGPAHVGLVGYLSGDVDASYAGAAGAQSLDNSYFDALVASHPGLSLTQFGIYPA